MVGGLADWFAVTALFRHPLGLPIPHTNLIARNQARIAEGVARYIDHEFLRREMLVDLDNLVGSVGLATTPLGPSGKARFGNHLVDVISSGEFISRDSQVVVTEVHGNRVVVRLAAGGNSATM